MSTTLAGQALRHSAAIAAVATCLMGLAATAQVSGLAGRWTQASSGEELVIRSKVKITPSIAPGTGFSLGGTTGFGSATQTMLVTEPTLTKVQRRMNLAIQSDGRFTWTIERQYPESANCTRTVRQEKRGTVAVESGSAVFSVVGGDETSRNSCGGETSGALASAQERYSVTQTGAGLNLSGPSVRWSFTRGG